MITARLTAWLCFVALMSSLLSCAGLSTKSAAQSEFDAGLSLFNRGRYADALPHFEQATEFEPNFGKAYLYLGRSYLNLSRWNEAVPPLRTAFRLSPEESRMQMADIILDVLLQNAAQIEFEERMQIKDLILPPDED